jgi:hypothetical protein
MKTCIKTFIVSVLLILSSNTFAQILEDGEYFIQISKTGKYLAISDNNFMNGGLLVQWDFANRDNHKFIVKKLKDGTYSIMAKHSGLYLNAEGAKTENGVRVIQWDWVEQDNMKWYIVRNQKEGGWYIMGKQSQKRLNLTGKVNNTTNGSVICISDFYPEQVFSFYKTK